MNQPVTGESIAHLADLTSTRHLLNYVHRDPEIIEMIGINDKELKLEDVAAAFMNGNETQVEEWFYKESLTVDRPEDLGLAAHCIRVEPFYLYKLTGGRYE